ncbi:hypothetical protein B296_00035765 [Ensete ventricosum]|uniref:Uncharacterized protein n=1 Tax=Ensete ventricosum TaxID=4639 RepID=A0A426Y7V6_ENSVE|nr:hypothetical protein B296_00035765 [Ensete ventricosum]
MRHPRHVRRKSSVDSYGHPAHGRHLAGAVPASDAHDGSVGAALLRVGHERYPYGLAVGKIAPCRLAVGGHNPYGLVAGKCHPLWASCGQVLPLRP